MISTLESAGIIPAEASSDIREFVASYYRKVDIILSYRPASVLHASTSVTLIRASESVQQVESLGEDYGLSAICDGQVDIHVIQGAHESFIADNPTELARLFDTLLSE